MLLQSGYQTTICISLLWLAREYIQALSLVVYSVSLSTKLTNFIIINYS